MNETRSKLFDAGAQAQPEHLAGDKLETCQSRLERHIRQCVPCAVRVRSTEGLGVSAATS